MILQWSSIVRPPHTSHGPASTAGGAWCAPLPREEPGIARRCEADSRIIGHRMGRREEEDDGLLACGLAHATDELPTDPFALVPLPAREVGQVRAGAAVGEGACDPHEPLAVPCRHGQVRPLEHPADPAEVLRWASDARASEEVRNLAGRDAVVQAVVDRHGGPPGVGVRPDRLIGTAARRRSRTGSLRSPGSRTPDIVSSPGPRARAGRRLAPGVRTVQGAVAGAGAGWAARSGG